MAALSAASSPPLLAPAPPAASLPEAIQGEGLSHGRLRRSLVHVHVHMPCMRMRVPVKKFALVLVFLAC